MRLRRPRVVLVPVRVPSLRGFGLGVLAGGLAFYAWGVLRQASRERPQAGDAKARRPAGTRARRRASGWDIAPGESLLPGGERDVVLEASMESFPASDPPAVFGDPTRRNGA